MMSRGTSEDVVVVKAALPGLAMRFLCDRDAGEVRWELTYLDDRSGAVLDREERRIRAVEMVNIDAVLGGLREAISAMTPRRRPDLAALHPPESAGDDE